MTKELESYIERQEAEKRLAVLMELVITVGIILELLMIE